MDTATPRYTHDCARCRFMGQVAKYDLYYCPGHQAGSSGIARFGSEPSQYASLGFFEGQITNVHRQIGGLTHDQAFVIALFRALPSLLLNVWVRPSDAAPTAP